MFHKRLDDALILAAKAHEKQYRKGTDIPYIVHPVHVALIMLRYGCSDDVTIAAILHDVVEDADIGISYIERVFGANVAELVEVLTVPKLDASGARIPWGIRRRIALEKIQGANRDAVLIKSADALHNIWTLAIEYEMVGESVWNRFNASADKILDDYTNIYGMAKTRLGNHPLLDDFAVALNKLRAIVDAAS